MKAKINPKVVVSIVYITAMFMAAMDATIVNVALQTISNELQVPPSAMGTVNVGYLVSLAVFLPISGWLGDRLVRKEYFSCSFRIYKPHLRYVDSERYYILEYFSYYSRCWWGL